MIETIDEGDIFSDSIRFPGVASDVVKIVVWSFFLSIGFLNMYPLSKISYLQYLRYFPFMSHRHRSSRSVRLMYFYLNDFFLITVLFSS